MVHKDGSHKRSTQAIQQPKQAGHAEVCGSSSSSYREAGANWQESKLVSRLMTSKEQL